MISNLIYMEGYGLFVWLSFGIVIISCFLVYIKTKKTLRKYEKEFLAELQKALEINTKRGKWAVPHGVWQAKQL